MKAGDKAVVRSGRPGGKVIHWGSKAKDQLLGQINTPLVMGHCSTIPVHLDSQAGCRDSVFMQVLKGFLVTRGNLPYLHLL